MEAVLPQQGGTDAAGRSGKEGMRHAGYDSSRACLGSQGNPCARAGRLRLQSAAAGEVDRWIVDTVLPVKRKDLLTGKTAHNLADKEGVFLVRQSKDERVCAWRHRERTFWICREQAGGHRQP